MLNQILPTSTIRNIWKTKKENLLEILGYPKKTLTKGEFFPLIKNVKTKLQ